ncbi:MAG: hypothetical protein II567_15555, partial [Candidatus Riflebacteria bacterium]|nr:hypothetical protein [Candidatus Riflebacteria bacterium]
HVYDYDYAHAHDHVRDYGLVGGDDYVHYCGHHYLHRGRDHGHHHHHHDTFHDDVPLNNYFQYELKELKYS